MALASRILQLLPLLVVAGAAMSVSGEERTDDVLPRQARETFREATRDFAEFGVVKRQHSPEKSLDDWRQHGFAFSDQRGDEFEALRVDQVESTNDLRRVKAREIDGERFRAYFEPRREPFIIEGLPEYNDWEAAKWTIPFLAEEYPSMKVKVGGDENGAPILMSMADFARYTKTQKDDAPLYVFDDEVYEDQIGHEVMKQYRVPAIFDDDLFTLVQGDEEYPSYRWLLLGPKRSGSSTHNDPLGTSAWNTLISGRKLWFLAPPHLQDIVMPTRDKCVTRWFIEQLPKLRSMYDDEITVFVQHPGETIFVPSFWMHAVLNLDDTVAVTQNFVSTNSFTDAWGLIMELQRDLGVRLLQQLVVHREDLALIALQINASTKKHRAYLARRRVEEDDDDDG